jgi:hypothetical protein
MPELAVATGADTIAAIAPCRKRSHLLAIESGQSKAPDHVFSHPLNWEIRVDDLIT